MKPEEQLMHERIRKLNEIKELGINPYAYKFEKKNYAKDLQNEFRKLDKEKRTMTRVSVAGRIMLLRRMGRASFAQLQDQTGRIQLYFSLDNIKKNKYKFLKKLDMGDFIGAEGTIFKTKTGELTIDVKEYQLLTKSLRPLPDKYHGLKDIEIKYRQRYLDLIMTSKTRETFIIRSKIINAMREFLVKRGYIEVETPILQPVYGGGFARPFVTHHNVLDTDMYLRISDEMYLKRLIVGGYEKVFEFSPDFRNEGVDTTHNPEFLQIEMMTAYTDYLDGMKLIEEIIAYCVNKVLGTTKVIFHGTEYDLGKWEKLTMVESINKYFKIDPENMSEDQLIEFIQKNKVKAEGTRKGELINTIFEELVQSKLVQPTIIYEYPVEVSALAKECRSKPGYTERFEMFIHGVEYGNNYTELTNPQVIKKRFKEELKRGGDEIHPMDEDFVLAMEYGMPPTCGTAIGIDRLMMLLTDSSSIRDVILFPAMKPEGYVDAGKAKISQIAIAVINKGLELEPWEQMNTIAHLNAAFGARKGKGLFMQDTIETKDNKKINLNIQHAIMIKEARKNKEILELVKKAKDMELDVAEFIREMIETTDDKKIIESAKGKNLKDVEYLGVLVFGKKSIVQKLTHKLDLFSGFFEKPKKK